MLLSALICRAHGLANPGLLTARARCESALADGSRCGCSRARLLFELWHYVACARLIAPTCARPRPRAPLAAVLTIRLVSRRLWPVSSRSGGFSSDRPRSQRACIAVPAAARAVMSALGDRRVPAAVASSRPASARRSLVLESQRASLVAHSCAWVFALPVRISGSRGGPKTTDNPPFSRSRTAQSALCRASRGRGGPAARLFLRPLERPACACSAWAIYMGA